MLPRISFESPYEEGTNIALGTPFKANETGRFLPWYKPVESKATFNWKEKWLALRSRFERLMDQTVPLDCTLMQGRLPAFGMQRNDLPPAVRGRPSILACGGLRQEPAFLTKPDFSPLKGIFPIKSAKGEPLLNEDGEYAALRFGLWRNYFVQPPVNWSPAGGAFHEAKFNELAQNATNLIYELPPEIAVGLWRNWTCGFSMSQNSGASLWLDALFELSWQLQPGGALYSKRSAWESNCSHGLIGDGLFPRLPPYGSSEPDTSLIHEHGYPLAQCSTIKNVIRASVAAIDEVLQRARLMETSERRFSIGLSFPGEYRTFVEKTADSLANRVGKGRVLYDKYHEAEFARLNLDVYLPNLYQAECDLIAVFLCREYTDKRWCKLEWRSIRQLIESAKGARIMLLSFDSVGAIPEMGIYEGDGYVSIGRRGPEAIATLILERLEHLR